MNDDKSTIDSNPNEQFIREVRELANEFDAGILVLASYVCEITAMRDELSHLSRKAHELQERLRVLEGGSK